MKTLKRLLEAFYRGDEKAILERQAEGGPHLAGGSPRFMEWVEEVYAPYFAFQAQAGAITEPEGFLEKYVFRFGYKASR